MNRQQQDLSWACLPKEVRNHIRSDYEYYLKRYEAVNANTAKGAIDALEDLFGHHNLTSDTEPEEILYVKRSKVCHLYECYKPYQRTSNEVVKDILEVVFGDKCLPDKEEPAPKFKVGDKVRVLENAELADNRGKIATIVKQGECCKGYGWVLDISKSVFLEPELELYIEPRFMVGEKVRIIKQNHSLYGKTAIVDVPMKDAPEILVNRLGNLYSFYESDLAPYTEPETKDNMEEKELNLAELLKGCEEEEFYCPYLRNNVKFIGFDEHDGMTFILSLYKDGLGYENLMYIKKNENIGKSFVLYPSKELYEKYPLDAKKAWREWSENRKPKPWRAKSSAGVAVSKCEGHWTDYTYWYITSDGVIAQDEETGCQADTLRYDFGNYFRTEDLAQQAAEAVKECLERFHKDHTNNESKSE